MKVTNVLKNVGVGVLVTMLVGCASVGSAARGSVSNNKTGVLYGYVSTELKSTAKELCDSIKNSDERCREANKYQSVAIVSSHGFSDGGYGIMALAEGGMNIDKCSRPKFKDCTYYKVSVTAGKLGAITEVASKPKEGKCDWTGLNGAGGTVCPAYNWDYRKDNAVAVEY